jgi:hypothetical protein
MAHENAAFVHVMNDMDRRNRFNDGRQGMSFAGHIDAEPFSMRNSKPLFDPWKYTCGSPDCRRIATLMVTPHFTLLACA